MKTVLIPGTDEDGSIEDFEVEIREVAGVVSGHCSTLFSSHKACWSSSSYNYISIICHSRHLTCVACVRAPNLCSLYILFYWVYNLNK